MKIMDKKEKNDLIEQLEYEISKKMLHLYDQKLYEILRDDYLNARKRQ